MKKIETIWHYLLHQAIEKNNFRHTQVGLAKDFSYSTSTVNLALTKPTSIGALRKSGKFFVVTDPKKLLYLWATHRNLNKDLIYSTTSTLPIKELEGLAPPTALYGGYSAAKEILGEPAADYNTLYLYLDKVKLADLKLRYPNSKVGTSQIRVLQSPFYSPTPHHTSLTHTFVDIWNMADWYSTDFITSLETKIHELLS